ncbi:MAG TPA: MFS transporter [Balneolaceae bacterium]|nr:MFS transporter [Balneolaceae bacterium]|tara:strand:- start:72834 stop:74252 length:1419 start_codon:yes stop_codon:yes gene_type:complete
MSQSNQQNNLYIALITIVATLGGLLFGFDSGVINGTVDGLQVAFNSDSVGTGFNVASMLLGCAVGAFFAGRLADQFGRRTLLIVAALFFIISAWGSGIANTSSFFVVFRVIGGLAVGAASVMSPAYISEIAPAHLRGRLSSIQQVAIITGLFLAFVSNYIVANAAGSALSEFWLGYQAWRWMFWIELIPAGIFFISLLFIPESPRFFAVKNQPDKALDVLSLLFGKESAEKKMVEINASLGSHTKPKFSDLLNKVTGKVHPIVWVGIGLAVFQQLVGINVVFYYGAVLWQSVGYSEADSLLINVISGAVSIAAVLISMVLIDKLGRKPLLLWGSVGMAITLAIVSIAFSTGSLDANNNLQLSENMGIVALIAANAYVMFFNGSWGPVMWVLLGEMFPNQQRGSGLAVSGLSQWFANFGITMTFPIMLSSIGLTGAYGIYAFFAALSVLFVIKMVKETKGLELEDMNKLWGID